MGYFEQIILQNEINLMKRAKELGGIIQEVKEIKESDLKEVKGLGVKSIDLLRSNGINTKEELKNTPIEKIREYITSPITISQIELFLNN